MGYTSTDNDALEGDRCSQDAQQFLRMARERDMERKRVRGEASCAECKRLKLKCDKQIPCSTCVRRRCTELCPNGSLETNVRHNTRSNLAKIDKLQGKLLEMTKRIRQLEDALQIAQASISSTPHPLLTDELLAIKTITDAPEKPEEIETDPDVLASFGKLTLSEGGEFNFSGCSGFGAPTFGNRGMSDATTQDETCDAINSFNVPNDVAHLSEAFPFASTILRRDTLVARILAYLPSRVRATALIEAYLEHLSWFFRPVEQEQIMDELMPKFYDAFTASGGYYGVPQNLEKVVDSGIHELSLILMVFALGAAADITQSPSNDEAELYRQLARAALSLKSVFQDTSMATVQSVAMMGIHDFFTCRTDTLEVSWKILEFAFCLGASIGLHRDPNHLNLSPKLVQRQRGFFWELNTMDSWRCLVTGKLKIFRAAEVDCPYPEDREAHISEGGSILCGLWRWKHDYTKKLVSNVAEQLCSIRSIKYANIMELDRKIRDYPRQLAEKERNVSDSIFYDHVGEAMGELFREITLMVLHRNFFAKAISETSLKPLLSPFAPSVLAAYASATKFLGMLRVEFDRSSSSLLRHWPLWANAFTAGVIVGIMAVRIACSAFASTAPQELDLAIALFEKATYHPIVKKGLTVFRQLRDRARSNLGVAHDHVIPYTIESSPMDIPSTETNGGPIDTGHTDSARSTRRNICLSTIDSESSFLPLPYETVQQNAELDSFTLNLLAWLGNQQQAQTLQAQNRSDSQRSCETGHNSNVLAASDALAEQLIAEGFSTATMGSLNASYLPIYGSSGGNFRTAVTPWSASQVDVTLDPTLVGFHPHPYSNLSGSGLSTGFAENADYGPREGRGPDVLAGATCMTEAQARGDGTIAMSEDWISMLAGALNPILGAPEADTSNL